ncbi:MAG: P27 family phage terminase small subunit [Faecalibacterium sp.]|nr:P27 family phage terminase small subunit [Ruminococcus sp.]MCM1392095.1 P27 family phage terminase small subunit [Ruminococcus sp.]MCM1485792.1 P27 family phage terminase small subunit [Faecalibacterium sp.]
MGRPCKAMATKSGAMSRVESDARTEIEEAISGGKEQISRATMPLTKDQKRIRKKLVAELKNVLTNVDCYILDQCCIAIDRIQKLEQLVNEEPQKMCEKGILSAKKQYFSEFVRLCSELSMSPQSRAKIANAMTAPVAKNPILQLLSDDDD